MFKNFLVADRLLALTKVCVGVAVTVMAIATWSANAQTIESLRVENNPTELGEATRFQLSLKEATGTAWCGLRIEFGNGTFRDIRIGEAGIDDLKPTFSALYASPGRYQVSVKGRNLSRGLKSAQACDGQAQSSVTVEDTQTRKLREELERRERSAQLQQPDAQRNDIDRKRELDSRELELKRREAELELEKQKLDLEFRRRELEERERRIKEKESEIGRRLQLKISPSEDGGAARNPGSVTQPLKDQPRPGPDSQQSNSNSGSHAKTNGQRSAQQSLPTFQERDVVGAFRAYAKFSTEGCAIDAGPSRPQVTGELVGEGNVLVQAISIARCLATNVPTNYLLVLKVVEGRPSVTRGAPVNGFVEKLFLSSGLVVVETLVFAEGDSSCCPSQREKRSYRPNADRLLLAATERLGKPESNQQPTRPAKPREALPSLPDKPS